MSRRRLAAGAVIALLVVAGAVAGLAALASRQQSRVLRAAGRALGRDLQAEHVGLTFRGGVGVALDGVTIGDDRAFGGTEPFLTARRLRMRLSLLPLLRQRLVVDRVVVDEPVVRLVCDRAGRLNVATLGGRARRANAAPSPAPHHGPAFQLGALRLRHGTVRYTDRATGRSLELTEVAVDAREPRFGAPMPLVVRAQLAGTGLRLDDIVTQGVLDLAGTQPDYRGTVTAARGTLGSLPFTHARATVHASPPDLVLDAATVELLGGTATGDAHLTASALAAHLSGRRLDLASAPARRGVPHAAGALELDAALGGPAPGVEGFRNALAGSGGFRVADGRVAGVGVGAAVLDVLRPVIGSGTADRLRSRYPDLLGSDDLRFTKLSGTGRLAGGRVHSDDLVLAGQSYDAHAAGDLGLDGETDVTVRVLASPELTDDVLGRSRLRPVLVDDGGRLAIPLRVHGPLPHPRVTPEPAFVATITRGLLTESGLGEKASSLLERLLGGKRHHGR